MQFLAPGMASFGVVMATFSFLAVGLAEARATGVIKRQSGAPALLPGPHRRADGRGLVLGLTLDGPRCDRAACLLRPHRAGPVGGRDRRDADHRVGSLRALGLALAMALPTMQLTLAVTNGIVILLAFISDMFMVGAQMPQTLSTIGWLFFPLKHLTALFSDALNPYLTGSGFEPRPPRRHRAVGPRRCRRRHSAAAPRPRP